jgi:hypothetical protein
MPRRRKRDLEAPPQSVRAPPLPPPEEQAWYVDQDGRFRPEHVPPLVSLTEIQLQTEVSVMRRRDGKTAYSDVQKLMFKVEDLEGNIASYIKKINDGKVIPSEVELQRIINICRKMSDISNVWKQVAVKTEQFTRGR